jgi:hypothetical protein
MEKKTPPPRDSNSRPSGLEHRASTSYATACTLLIVNIFLIFTTMILWHDYLNVIRCVVTARSTGEPLLGNGSPTHKQQWRNWWKWCFLCGPYRSYIATTVGRNVTLTLTLTSLLTKDKTHPIIREDVHKDYDRKGSVAKKLWSWAQEAWGKDELIGGKPPVVK